MTALGLGLILTTVGGVAFAQERASPMPSHLPLGVEACFGRTYDAAHLRAHPRQRVTGFHLLRDFTPDTHSEDEPDSRDERIKADGEYGSIGLTAYLRLRDRKGVYSNSFSCTRNDSGVVHCGIDCDGGSFKLRAAGQSLTVENEGFVVVGGCGATEDENENPVTVRPGADDRTFRLDPQPLAQCTALRDAQKPAWAKLGTPLRIRFAVTETLCLGRSYDAAHLRAHPQQQVRRIAVLKSGGDAAKDAPQYSLVFRAELRDGRKVEGRTNCWPDGYAYACTHDSNLDTQRSFYLTRAGENVMLRDRRGSLGALLKVKLGRGDDLFRLEPAAAEACRF